MDKTDLVVDFCSYKAAKYAVMNWHYSKSMPSGKLVKIGAWEFNKFIGCVVYGRGANNNIGKPYDLKQTEICELVRIALTDHLTPVSRIVSMAQKLLKKTSPSLRLIVSYADPEQNHHGGIYQAMNWVYVGTSKPQPATVDKSGSIVHKRTAYAKFGTVSVHQYSKILFKHKYLCPLDKTIRRQIEPLSKPYPKRADVVRK